MAQNEIMMRPRVRNSMVDSGGGCFLELTANAFEGAGSGFTWLALVSGSSVIASLVRSNWLTR